MFLWDNLVYATNSNDPVLFSQLLSQTSDEEKLTAIYEGYSEWCRAEVSLPDIAPGVFAYEKIIDALVESGSMNMKVGVPSFTGSETLLSYLTSRNNKNALTSLLKHKEKLHLNVASDRAIFIATWAGDIETLTLLIASGANVNLRYPAEPYFNPNHTPLHSAASSNNREVYNFLLANNADPNLKNHRDETPRFNEKSKYWRKEPTSLYAAVDNRHYKKVVKFIADGADVNEKSVHGKSPLHELFNMGNGCQFAPCLRILRALVEAGANVNEIRSIDKTPDRKKGETVLHIAAENRYLDAMRILIKAGADVNAKTEEDETPLLKAVDVDGCYQTIVELLAAGANPNLISSSSSPIELVIKYHTECVIPLMEANLKIKWKDSYRTTVKKESEIFYIYNMTSYYDKERTLTTSLARYFRAIMSIRADLVPLDIIAAEYEYVKNEHSSNNLAAFVSLKLSNTIKFYNLLKEKKFSEALNSYISADIVRHFTIELGENASSIYHILYKHAEFDADAEAILNYYKTQKSADFIAEHIKLANVTDNEGRSLVHWLAYHDDVDTLKAVVNAGADIFVKDNNGKTPFMLAKECKAYDVIRMLFEFILENTTTNIAVEHIQAAVADLGEDCQHLVPKRLADSLHFYALLERGNLDDIKNWLLINANLQLSFPIEKHGSVHHRLIALTENQPKMRVEILNLMSRHTTNPYIPNKEGKLAFELLAFDSLQAELFANKAHYELNILFSTATVELLNKICLQGYCPPAIIDVQNHSLDPANQLALLKSEIHHLLVKLSNDSFDLPEPLVTKINTLHDYDHARVNSSANSPTELSGDEHASMQALIIQLQNLNKLLFCELTPSATYLAAKEISLNQGFLIQIGKDIDQPPCSVSHST